MDKNREHELLSMYTFGSIGLPNFNQNLEKKQWCQDFQMAHPEQHWAPLPLEGRHESFHTWVFFKVLVTLSSNVVYQMKALDMWTCAFISNMCHYLAHFR